MSDVAEKLPAEPIPVVTEDEDRGPTFLETLMQKAPSITLIMGVFVLWEVLCLVFGVTDIILPRPTQIIVELYDRFPAIWPHMYQTLYTTILGFAFGVCFGVLLGVLIGSSRLAYDTCYPLLVGISSIPKVAVVPILVIWFGVGTVPAVITACVICIFPIVVNVATGIATVEPELEDVMKTLKATKLDILWNVGLPRAMPYFFASLKVAITLAFIGSVVAETVASNRGVGNMMLIASSQFNTPLVFAGLFVLAFLGVAFYVLFTILEKRVTGWAHRKGGDVAVGGG